jgi:hypothetical protein
MTIDMSPQRFFFFFFFFWRIMLTACAVQQVNAQPSQVECPAFDFQGKIKIGRLASTFFPLLSFPPPQTPTFFAPFVSFQFHITFSLFLFPFSFSLQSYSFLPYTSYTYLTHVLALERLAHRRARR